VEPFTLDADIKMSDPTPNSKDFFISYTRRDRTWAEWIAWVLEEAGYSVIIQAWDFRPGGNFVLNMQEATEAKRTIAVLSALYLDKPFTQSEWAAAFAQDPTSRDRKLIPVRVEECHPPGLLAQIVYVDIFDCEETEAQQRLLAAVQDGRMKPDQRPRFPGKVVERLVPDHVPFPGTADPTLWFYAWEEAPNTGKPTFLLDWTKYYDRETRQIPDQATWNDVLLPELRHLKAQLKQSSSSGCLNVKARAPLTAMLALGYVFPEVGGYHFQIEQLTGNQVFQWRSDTSPSNLKFKVEEKGQAGKDLLIVFSIIDSAKADAIELIRDSRGMFSSVVYAEPNTAPSKQAIQSAADAVSLAEDAREIIQRSVKKYRAKTTHLILYAPQVFCLFLGQKLNALGEVVAYERTPEGKYQVSIRLQTG